MRNPSHVFSPYDGEVRNLVRFEGGDAWFGNSSNYFNNPVKGNYAYFTVIHEIGHTLGLKHAHKSMGVFGAIPVDRDFTEYTVMTYRSYIGASTANYTNGGWSYPQTVMMYDIAALQKLYGANYQTNNTDTVYQWDPNTGELFVNGTGQGAPGGNQVFMTLWDGGGSDTYDFSNYATDLAVSLHPVSGASLRLSSSRIWVTATMPRVTSPTLSSINRTQPH